MQLQAEELGMADVCVQGEPTSIVLCSESDSDIFVDDFVRTPFQWDATTSAGFSTNVNPWMPVSADYKTNNVVEQEKDIKSHYNTYKNLQKVRQHDAIKTGDFSIQTLNEAVFILKK